MKYFWISFLLSLFCFMTSQEDTLHIYQVFHNFSNQEKSEWTAFENNWNYIDYSRLKQKYNIKKLNCKNCGDFYADIYVEINDVGKLITIHFKKGKICGRDISNEILTKKFEESLKTRTFKYLNNKHFIARFGYVLKC